MRPRVRAAFRIGPWVPGAALPVVLGLVGAGASAVALQGGAVVIGLVLALLAALRVRTALPWLLIAALVVGQGLRGATGLDAGLPALVLAVHLLAVLTLRARVVPVRSRLQLAALGPDAISIGLVQVPAQVLAVLLLASTGRLQALPVASAAGGALLVLVAGLLAVPRRGGSGDAVPPGSGPGD